VGRRERKKREGRKEGKKGRRGREREKKILSRRPANKVEVKKKRRQGRRNKIKESLNRYIVLVKNPERDCRVKGRNYQGSNTRKFFRSIEYLRIRHKRHPMYQSYHCKISIC
jgi:hypothetical protein